jgi:hypothetical protein
LLNKSKNLVGIVGIEGVFSLSHLKQTKVDQEAIKEGREEGQQRGKLPAKFRLYYPRYCLRLRQGKGAISSRKLPSKSLRNRAIL